MIRQLTVISNGEEGGYVALCPELDIASQGDTATARANLEEALEPFFETASDAEIRRRLLQAKDVATMRQVVLYPDEDGIWIVECPSIPGCVSQGETKSESIANIKEAIELCIAVFEEEGRPAPEERFETLVVAV